MRDEPHSMCEMYIYKNLFSTPEQRTRLRSVLLSPETFAPIIRQAGLDWPPHYFVWRSSLKLWPEAWSVDYVICAQECESDNVHNRLPDSYILKKKPKLKLQIGSSP